MFEAFKKLFSRQASPPPTTAPVTEERAPAPASRWSPPAPRSITAGPGIIPKKTGDVIVLPLNEVLSRLPVPLASLVVLRPGGTFSFSASVALEQLRTGAVRIPFSQLRQGSPPGTFANNVAHDDALIDLPLPLVLAAIGPAGLARRTDQKRVVVPDEVTGVFGAKHGKLNPGIVVTSAPSASSTAPKAVTAAPVASSPTEPEPAAPAPVALAPSVPKPAVPAPAPIPTPIVPRPTATVTPVVQPTTAHKPTTSIASRPAASKPTSPLPFATLRPSPPPPSAVPAPAILAVVTTIEELSGAWPDPVRHEIQQFELGSASISIPVNRLEAGMKTGRVVFTWAELCGWLNVPMPPSANGESAVELPLKVIAPLFLAIPRAAKPRKVVSIGEHVPDLFAGLRRPAASAPAAALPAEPDVAPPPLPPPPATAHPIEEKIFGQPSKPDWTPAEIVEKILALPGVAGALLASKDGLLVAGQMPAPLKVEMMAAFLPQMFTHISGNTEEVQLGTLRALKLTTDEAACAVFQAGALCLAVLGQPGQTLPESALERIAGELAQIKH